MFHRRTGYALAALALFWVICAMPATGQETGYGRHARMFAVPAPGRVAIDGKLDDWDLSGRVQLYITEAMKDERSGEIALMYDNEALYVAGDILDDSPMMNRHSPEANGNKAWDADSIQFRICVDPTLGYPVDEGKDVPDEEAKDALTHMLFWYYTDRQEPNMQLHTSMRYHEPEQAGKFGVMPEDSFQAAYAKREDGRGYTFEYRLPWKTLGAPRPLRGGDVVPGTLQINWGQPTGLIIIRRGGAAYDVLHPDAKGGRTYQSSVGWGKIVFSEEGRLDRALTEPSQEEPEPTPLEFAFDLPKDGEATITLFDENHVAVRTLLAAEKQKAGKVTIRWDGLDELGIPLPAGTYQWKGLYHDPITTHYVMAVNNSGHPSYKTDDYTGGWGADHGVPTAALATADGLVLGWNGPETGSGQIGVDRTGQRRWGTRNGCRFLALAGDGERYFSCGGGGFQVGNGVRCYAVKDGHNLAFGNGAGILKAPENLGAADAVETGIAAGNGTLYVAYGEQDRIVLFDAKSGEMGKVWEVASPGAMALAVDGSLLVISGNKVLSVKDGQAETRIDSHLDAPFGITVGPKGRVYVSNRGKLQNVSVFDPSGKYLRSIGKPGGRPPMGRFEDNGMFMPAGMTVDAEGRLWVAEMTHQVKRHSVWDSVTGAFIMDFFGGADYSSLTTVDPERPEEVYNGGVLWKVDYDKGTCRPYSAVWYSENPNTIHSARHDFRVFTATNGRQYGWHAVAGQSFLFIREGDIFKPFLAFFWPGRRGHMPVMDELDAKDKRLGATYAWQDQNDDKIIQASEVREIGPRNLRGFSWVDKDLTIWHGRSGPFAYKEVKRGKRTRMDWVQEGKGSAYWKPLRIEDNGLPRYDFAQAGQTPVYGTNTQGPFVVDPQDDSLYVSRPQSTRRGRQWDTRAIDWGRYTPDGKLLWGYKGVWEWKGALSMPPQRPGKIWGPTCPIPPEGNFQGFASYFGTYHLYTRDGLCVAMLMRDPREHPGFGPDVNACETWNGQLLHNRNNGKWYFFHGDQDGRIQEVRGLDTVTSLDGGEVAISEADRKKVVAAQAEYKASQSRLQRMVIVRTRKAIDMNRPVERTGTGAQMFQVRAAYDDNNLYLRYDVTAPHGLENREPQTHLVFKGGNLIDLQMATRPDAPGDRKTAAPGDIRLLISRRDDKPLAVLYRTKVKDFEGEPLVLKSPTGTESFDAIEDVSDRIRLDYHPRKEGDGFRAYVTIPLSLIGWEPKPQSTIRLDAGYIFGNEGGTQAMRRLYWTNNSFSANVLNDVPHESRLEPHEWGAAEVE